jgi:2-methylaconitate cis-trans-isomerase PrpF
MSSRPEADLDYTFVQMFPDQPAAISYKLNCGNLSSGVPVFALMKNILPNVKGGLNTLRVFSTNSQKMIYMTLDVLNGEARVGGDCKIGGVPGTGGRVLVDFRDQSGAFTGRLFPTGKLVDTVEMDNGTSVEVTIMDMVNPCGFFDARSFGLGSTGLELPNPDGSLK